MQHGGTDTYFKQVKNNIKLHILSPFLASSLPSGKLSVKVMVTIHQMEPFHSRDSEHWLYTTIFDSIDKRF